MTTDHALSETFARYRKRVEQTLTNALSTCSASTVLQDAMRYSTLNGGKRLRPILVYAVGDCFGQSCEALDNIAAAIECVHCYSLIHDDLPAMDDDSLRRGFPTTHIIFNEAIAILAGDALQTLAFELLSSHQNADFSAEMQLKMIATLANYSGASGIAAGQALDLLAEGKNISITELEQLHALKTGALIKASIIMGALGAGCTDAAVHTKLNLFSDYFGLAFQLQDDLQDVIGDIKQVGKNANQDSKHHKSTYAILLGVDETKSKINMLLNESLKVLKTLERDTTLLEKLCLYFVSIE